VEVTVGEDGSKLLVLLDAGDPRHKVRTPGGPIHRLPERSRRTFASVLGAEPADAVESGDHPMAAGGLGCPGSEPYELASHRLTPSVRTTS
jgi:hypothetical protein